MLNAACAAFVATLFVATTQLATPSTADERRIYVFGNSLFHHLSATPETTVPYWLAKIATESKATFTLDGQWGFLKDFHAKLPPQANWSFKGVRKSWTGEGRPFQDVGFNTIITNPENFIQSRPPKALYEWDNAVRVSPVTAVQKLFAWLKPRTRNAQFFVYEGWADMGVLAPNFPPSPAKFADYHRSNLGDYHNWYEAFVQEVEKTGDFGKLRLIPAGSAIATLLTKTDLSALEATDLYSDNAPHGTANTYFLAALVTYAALFDKRPPTVLTLPASIHAAIKANLGTIADTICENDHIRCASAE